MICPEGSFVPGDGVAVVTTRWTALVLADRAHPTVELLVELGLGSDQQPGQDPAAAETVLEALGRQGFDLLPPLGVVAWDPGACRILLRGGVVAEVADRTGDAPAEVDSAGVLTWSEHLLVDAAAVTLRVPGSGPSDGGSGFWTACGVVAADLITSGPPATAPPSPTWSTPAAPPTPPPTPPPTRPEAPRHADEPGDASGDSAEDAPDDGRTLVSPPEPATVTVDEQKYADPSIPEPDEEQPAPPPFTPPEPSAFESPDLPESQPIDAPVEADDLEDPDDDGGYDHLFGSTIVRTVEDAAVRDVAPSDGGTDARSERADRGHDSAVDHDGMTITVSELRRLRQAESGVPLDGPPPPPASASPDGEHVTRQCPTGHLNPPQATACRVCGRPVDGETFRVDRIELGTFRFSTGRTVPVAGTILVGRSPKPPANPSGTVELVEVPSPRHDVSRTHLEVRVEGWQVLVVDRGSTNGTVITIPGRQPQRLRAGEPFPLPVGGSVSLADEAEFTYEVGG
jgi:hypothetical protein